VGDRDGGRGRTAADAFAALRFSRLFAAVPMTATRGQIARVNALTMIEILHTHATFDVRWRDSTRRVET
jgi:hypothetical protein